MRSWMSITRRELRTIFTDMRVALIMLLGPFFYGLLFGAVYWNGRVREVPTIVIDQDHSQLSRDLAQAVNASDSLKTIGYGKSTQDFAEAARRGEASIGLYIPSHFQRDLKKGHQGEVVVMVDGSNTLIANVGYRAIRTVLATYRVGARQTRLMATGVPRRAVSRQALPVQAEIVALFNPAVNYSTFLLMGLTCIALQQVTMLGAAIALGLDSDPRKRQSLLAISRSPLLVLLGRLTAHLLVMIPLSLIAIYLPFSVFGTSFHGSWLLVLGMTAIFIGVNVLSGFGVAGVCRAPLLATQVLLAVSVPIFILTGFTWPAMAMPVWVQRLGQLLPLTYYADLVRKVSLMGASAEMLKTQITAIIVWVPIAAIWGYWAVRRFVRMSPEETA